VDVSVIRSILIWVGEGHYIEAVNSVHSCSQ